MNLIIYKIQNKINGKIYIGQTIRDLNQRIADHLLMKSPIGNALRKYGLQCFDISIIDTAETKEWLNDKEMEYIYFYNSKSPNGYNLTDGGEGIFNPSQITLQRMRDSHLGKKQLEQTKKKRSKSISKTKKSPEWNHKLLELSKKMKGENNPAKRPEVGAKITKAKKGFKFSKESKQRMRDSHLGKRLSEITKQKMKDSYKYKPPWNKGLTKETDERLNKLSLCLSNKHKESL